MAEQDDNSYTSAPIEPIPEWLADNYREKIEDPESNLSYEKFAEIHKDSAPALAAWARGQAARDGKDVTPHVATPAPQPRRYADLKVEELKDELEKRPHIDASEAKLKADIVKLLEQDDASKAAAQTQAVGGDNNTNPPTSDPGQTNVDVSGQRTADDTGSQGAE